MHNIEEPQSTHSQSTSISSRIVLDNMRPYHRCVLFLCLAILVTLWLVLQIHVCRHIFVIKTNQSELSETLDNSCLNPSTFANGFLVCDEFDKNNPTLGLILRDVSHLNQFALISLEFEDHSDSKQSHQDIQQTITVSLYSLHLKITGKVGRFQQKQQVGFKSMSLSGRESGQDFMYSRLPLQHIIGLYRNLDQRNYLLLIKFQNPQAIFSQKLIPSLKAYLTNPTSALLVIIIRAAFFVISSFVFAVYFYFYFKVPASQRLIQQKLVFLLALSLLVFNDPLYFYTILRPNALKYALSYFSTVLSLACFIQMLGNLFLYIIASLRKIRDHQTNNLESPFQLVKKWECCVFYGSFFAIIGLLYSEIAISEYESEVLLYPFTISPALSILSLAWLALAVGYIFFLALQCFSKNRALWRTNGWSSFLVFVVLLLILYFFVLEIVWPQKSRSLMLMTFLAFTINIICLCTQILFIVLPNEGGEEFKFTKLSEEQLSAGDSVDIEMEDMN